MAHLSCELNKQKKTIHTSAFYISPGKVYENVPFAMVGPEYVRTNFGGKSPDDGIIAWYSALLKSLFYSENWFNRFCARDN